MEAPYFISISHAHEITVRQCDSLAGSLTSQTFYRRAQLLSRVDLGGEVQSIAAVSVSLHQGPNWRWYDVAAEMSRYFAEFLALKHQSRILGHLSNLVLHDGTC